MAKVPESRDIFIVAHPDDTEVMFGYRLSQSKNPWVLVASDGNASTIDFRGNDFVKRGERRGESKRGLAYYGVPLSQQCYLGLPDGELADNVPLLSDAILEMIGSSSVNSLVTFGHDGFDGHLDHQAMNRATLAAAQEYDGTSDVYTLDSSHNGLYVARGAVTRKLGAMAFHASQFDLENPAFWQNFAPYVPLITHGETYNTMSVVPQVV